MPFPGLPAARYPTPSPFPGPPMTVLFAHSFFMNFDEKQRQVREPYPPLGTLIAAACVRSAGYEVDLFDAMLAHSTEEFAEKLNGRDYQVVVFFEDNFNWLSKMCLDRMRQACRTMIAEARNQVALIIVAGSDPSDYPSVFLGAGADYVVKGEAEFRILEILNHHKEHEEPPFTGPGVFRLANGQVSGSPPVRGERNLAKFPEPAWDLVNMEAYRQTWLANHGYFSLNMMTTRGCPYRCNWCAKPIHGRRYDVREPTECAREMVSLKEHYQPDHIWFTDDIFGLKPKWVSRFADELQRLGGGIPFKIQGRADLMKPDLVKGLKKAGCQTVWMGVESGSQKVLDAMDKDLKIQQIHGAVALLQEAGIEVCFFLQFGYPGEGPAEIRATWDMVETLKPDQIGISVAYPLPGTPFYEKVKDQVGLRDHWEHSQDMRPMHDTFFPADFYPLLYRYFHFCFRKLKGTAPKGLSGIKDRLRGLWLQIRLRRLGMEGLFFP